MKRGHIIARRRFFKKYKTMIANGVLAMSIIVFGATFALTVYGNPFETKTAKAKYDVVSETKEVLSVDGDNITTIDNNNYVYENAEEKFNSIKEDNVSWQILIVDNEIVSMVAVYN